MHLTHHLIDVITSAAPTGNEMDFSLGTSGAAWASSPRPSSIVLGVMSLASLVVMFERIVVFTTARAASRRSFAEKMAAAALGRRRERGRPAPTWARTWATWAG